MSLAGNGRLERLGSVHHFAGRSITTQLLLDRTTLQLIVRTHDFGTIAAAARSLNLSASLATRKLAAAEEDLGARLFLRTAKSSHATEAGLLIVAWARDTLARETKMRDDLQVLREEVSGSIRFVCPEFLASNLLAGWLANFLERYPAVNLSLIAADRPVHIPDEFDVALHLGEKPDESLVGRKLYELPMGLYASRDYVERKGAPATIDALRAHRLIRHTWFNEDALCLDDDGVRRPIAMASNVDCSSGILAIEMMMRGAGIACVARRTMRMPRFRDHVVQILPNHEAVLASGGVWALWLLLPDRAPASRVRRFVDEIVQHLQQDPA